MSRVVRIPLTNVHCRRSVARGVNPLETLLAAELIIPGIVVLFGMRHAINPLVAPNRFLRSTASRSYQRADSTELSSSPIAGDDQAAIVV